jgi:hypothetical protein
VCAHAAAPKPASSLELRQRVEQVRAPSGTLLPMSPRARLAGALVFAVTMGLFEGAVVVYLRRLWELGAIDVAAVTLSNRLILTEVIREAASLVMIASVAWLSGRRPLERLGYAAVIFGTWDLVFYAILRLLIGWPAGLLDWDVLFLIPRAWIGPVLAPVLVSVLLVAGGTFVALREGTGPGLRFGAGAWTGAGLGGAVVIASFLMPTAPRSATDEPTGFSWGVFLAGLVLASASFLYGLWRSRADAGAGTASATAATGRVPGEDSR